MFTQGGVFSATVVGTMELLASLLILAGAFMSRQRLVQVTGATLVIDVISEAFFLSLYAFRHRSHQH